MRHRCLAALAVLVLTAGIAAANVSALTTAQLPADLRRLLVAARHLNLRGFLVHQSVVQTRDGRTVLVSRLVERGQVSPPRYALTSSVSGRAVLLRYIGSDAYGTSPGVAAVDGGHRWVRVHLPDLAGGQGNVLGLIRSYLSNLANVVLPPATSVQEVGPATLGGLAVTEFLVGTSTTPASTTRVFLAADGLPVRTVETVGDQVTTTDTSDTAPVIVRLPPVSETVDESRLSPAAQARVNDILAAPPGLQ